MNCSSCNRPCNDTGPDPVCPDCRIETVPDEVWTAFNKCCDGLEDKLREREEIINRFRRRSLRRGGLFV